LIEYKSASNKKDASNLTRFGRVPQLEKPVYYLTYLRIYP
jgi:hypothetical protein